MVGITGFMISGSKLTNVAVTVSTTLCIVLQNRIICQNETKRFVTHNCQKYASIFIIIISMVYT